MKDKIILFLIGLLILSSFSTYFTMDILKMPFCAIEILLIPTLLYYKKVINLSNKYTKPYLLLFILLFALGLLNLETNENIQSINSSARSFLLFGLGFSIAYKQHFLTKSNVLIILLGIIVGEFFMGFKTLSYMQIIDKEKALDMNIFIFPTIISISMFTKKNIYIFVAILICGLLSFLSITRGLVLYVVFSVIISLFVLLIQLKKSFIHILISGIIAISCGYIIYSSSENIILNISSSMHHRMYTKVKNIEEDTSQQDRIGHLKYVINNMESCLTPKGLCPVLAGKYKAQKNLLYRIRDCSILELLYIFGIFTILLLYFLLYISKSICLQYIRNKNPIDGILLCILLILPLYLILGYGLLIHPFTVLSLGIIVGFATQRIGKGVKSS